MEKPIPNSSESQGVHTVAIVGRPNVGKSAIFNRLAGRRIAIVHDQPGVTRDRISAPAKHGRHPYQVMDTGGIGATLDDGFAEQVAAEVDIAIETADLILFVVDGMEGLTPIDETLARQLRRAGHPVILLVNKLDHEKHDGSEVEFASLGFEVTLRTSAAHGRGFEVLEGAIDDALAGLPAPPAPVAIASSKEPIKVAIVGRPNVGKSSLINAILGEQRTIVSDVAGTTRDAVDVMHQVGGKDYLLIDTAGIRKRTRRDSSVEVFSAMRSERSIRRADICALVIDASSGVTSQDRRIAQTIVEEHTPCVILVNKFDLFHPDGPKRDRLALLTEQVRRDLFFLHYAPVIALSALKGQYISRLFHEINQVQKSASRVINTGALNRLLEEALLRNPPPLRKNKRLNILYASAVKTDKPGPIPVPHYMLFINRKDLLSQDYQRYLESQIRSVSPFEGLPIRMQMKARPPRKKK